MNKGKYVFVQLLDFVDLYQFEKCIDSYSGDMKVRTLSCKDQFKALVFGQLTGRESLRDVVNCLSAHNDKMYHFGFRKVIARSTLAKANKIRNWKIYRDFAHILINETRTLYSKDKEANIDFSETVYLIDSTMIDLCLSIFNWAYYKKEQSSVKLHMQIDLNGSIPTFFDITTGKVNDVNFLDKVNFESGAYYVMDRGYLDYERWYHVHKKGAFFVTRPRHNSGIRRLYSNKINKSEGVRCDQVVVLSAKNSFKRYPDKLRRIKYYDYESGKTFVFITNDFNTDSLTIALLYKNRWQVELFFKWIKQHLKIKKFWGISENALKMQICVALCTYLIVAIAKKKLGIKRNLYEILQILSVSLFDKKPLFELLTETRLQKNKEASPNQARLKGF